MDLFTTLSFEGDCYRLVKNWTHGKAVITIKSTLEEGIGMVTFNGYSVDIVSDLYLAWVGNTDGFDIKDYELDIFTTGSVDLEQCIKIAAKTVSLLMGRV